jgi:hypothetical protein
MAILLRPGAEIRLYELILTLRKGVGNSPDGFDKTL